MSDPLADRLESLLAEVSAMRDAAVMLTEDLAAMTTARDEACNMLERTIDELAEHEEDPDMMHGHRLALASWRKVGTP